MADIVISTTLDSSKALAEAAKVEAAIMRIAKAEEVAAETAKLWAAASEQASTATAAAANTASTRLTTATKLAAAFKAELDRGTLSARKLRDELALLKMPDLNPINLAGLNRASSAAKSTRADFEGLHQQWTQSLNSAFGEPVTNGLRAMAAAASRARTELERLRGTASGNVGSAATGLVPATSRGLTPIAEASNLPAILASGGALAMVMARSAGSMRVAQNSARAMAEGLRSGVIEGGKLREVFDAIGSDRGRGLNPNLALPKPTGAGLQKLIGASGITPDDLNRMAGAKASADAIRGSMNGAAANSRNFSRSMLDALGATQNTARASSLLSSITGGLASVGQKVGATYQSVAGTVRGSLAGGFTLLGTAANALGRGLLNAAAYAIVGSQALSRMGGSTSSALTPMNMFKAGLSGIASVGSSAVSFMGRFAASLLGVRSTLVGVGISTLLTRELGQASDEYLQLERRIKSSSRSFEESQAAMGLIKNSANALGVEIEVFGATFAKFQRSTQDWGASIQQVDQFTKAIILAARESGSSASEIKSVLTQLPQAFNALKLGGDELRSLLENAPALMQIMAKSAGVSIGELTKGFREGKYTVDQLFKAIGNGLPELAARAAQSGSTISEGFTRIKNAWLVTVGEMSKQTGFGDSITASLSRVAGVIASDGFKAALANVGTMLANGFEWLTKWLSQTRDVGFEFRKMVAQAQVLANYVPFRKLGDLDAVGKVERDKAAQDASPYNDPTNDVRRSFEAYRASVDATRGATQALTSELGVQLTEASRKAAGGVATAGDALRTLQATSQIKLVDPSALAGLDAFGLKLKYLREQAASGNLTANAKAEIAALSAEFASGSGAVAAYAKSITDGMSSADQRIAELKKTMDSASTWGPTYKNAEAEIGKLTWTSPEKVEGFSDRFCESEELQ
jgi:tape measure domain-containing protein